MNVDYKLVFILLMICYILLNFHVRFILYFGTLLFKDAKPINILNILFSLI